MSQRYILSRAAVKIDAASLDYTTAKLSALPMSYFNARRTGDIEQRLQGMRQVRQLLVQEGVRGLTAATQFAAALLADVPFQRAARVRLPGDRAVYAGLMRYSSKRMRPIFDTLQESYGRYKSRQIDAIKGIETVKALGAEDACAARWSSTSARSRNRIFRSDFMILAYEGRSRWSRCCRWRCSCGSARCRCCTHR